METSYLARRPDPEQKVPLRSHDVNLSPRQQTIEDQLNRLRRKFPIVGEHLPPLLRSDECQIAFAQVTDDPRLSTLRVNPSPAIEQVFDIALEIPVVVSAHDDLFPKTVYDTLKSLRMDAKVDPDIGVLVARDPHARRMLEIEQMNSGSTQTTILVGESELHGFRREGGMRALLASGLRVANRFAFSDEITDPSNFFGRRSEIERLHSLIISGQSVAVFGLRKSGKSSLLNQVALRLNPQVVTVPIQLNLIDSADQFREEILLKLAEAYLRTHQNIPELEFLTQGGKLRRGVTITHRWLADARTLLLALDTKVCIAIDEVDRAVDRRVTTQQGLPQSAATAQQFHEVLRSLRGLIQVVNKASPGRLTLLVAGVSADLATSATQFGQENQLFKFFTVVPLAGMERAEMRAMVRTLGKRSGLKFHESCYQWLFQSYGGHPHLTRTACSIIAEEKNRLPGAEIPYRVSESDLELINTSRSQESPYVEVAGVFESFGIAYPEEHRTLLELLSGRTLSGALRQRLPFSIDFGFIEPDGSLRVGALSDVVKDLNL